MTAALLSYLGGYCFSSSKDTISLKPAARRPKRSSSLGLLLAMTDGSSIHQVRAGMVEAPAFHLGHLRYPQTSEMRRKMTAHSQTNEATPLSLHYSPIIDAANEAKRRRLRYSSSTADNPSLAALK